jgi:hypothetical protein
MCMHAAPGHNLNYTEAALYVMVHDHDVRDLASMKQHEQRTLLAVMVSHSNPMHTCSSSTGHEEAQGHRLHRAPCP